MSSEDFFWEIDHRYRDSGVKEKGGRYDSDDEFASKVRIDNKGWGIQNSGGIRPLRSHVNKKAPAAIFLITTSISTSFHNPWDDEIDIFNGSITYWGDAKFHDKKRCDDWKGNIELVKVNQLINEGNFAEVPPILFFSKEKSGEVIFKGLVVLDNLEKKWFMDNEKNKRVENYRCSFTILNTPRIDPRWLKIRAKGDDDKSIKCCPEEWIKYINGEKKRLITWASKIRSKENQLPPPKSIGHDLIEKLSRMDPYDFEEDIRRVLESISGIHRIFRTKNVKDGGFDLEGEFLMQHPFNYSIKFKGEVKRHKASIGPKDVSRLVARLTRGEYGLFFTTSYFTTQAQKEAIEDDYPIKLISGKDLYDYYYESGLLDETVNS